ncbi:MepB family protein [Vagococcus bubulae]|uniref:MepB protein n=1 Tax=Vagococcus bubulae TaxID=1977868 RepID=A0A429ZPN9_9ENTE|nr:MepB family protein [Vagococcus bubulae]RST95651.1 hypothetical protein CBF36_02925 [Vagococcus bubulae]
MISLAYINHYFSPYSLSYERQNADYEGMFFYHCSISYRSRLAKKTPSKLGYFVSFWEKDTSNNNQPYSFSKAPDNTLIWVIDDNKKGLFTFPKEILLQKTILQTASKKGKMGIRVYPDWEVNLNNTAKKTQEWQTHFFQRIQ